MRPRQGATLAALALLCCLSVAAEAPVTGPGEARAVRRGARRSRPGGGRPARDIGRGDDDDDYLENLQRSFRGNTFRVLDVKGNRALGDPSIGIKRTGYSGGAEPGNRNTGPPRSVETDSQQRWLKILAEFLKTSKEGRELLQAQAGHLQVSPGGAARLPLPVLLVPVPVPDGQCPASKPPPFLQPGLEPPLPDYLPPGGRLPPSDGSLPGHTAPDEPITPGYKHVRPPSEAARVGLLLRLFRQERPRAPLLPPMLLPTSPAPSPAAPLPPLSPAPPPQRLRFSRSLLIRAELTVYYSDYTEPYTVWYDAASGASRVDMHGGTAVLYRAPQPDGHVQRVQLRIERYREEERRRCWRLATQAADADRLAPALPDPEPFVFDGYTDTEHGRLERWRHSVSGQAGELGGARGEALRFHHELLVARLRPDFAIPYKYQVRTDSSLLGPEVDWYEHRYLEVREQQPDPSYMSIRLEHECDVIERAPALEHVDPLREFVMTHRDTRCDTDFEKFKKTFDVLYGDAVEEAIRKTLLIRNTRFVESGNRQGAPALLGTNRLSVLLRAEKELLRGLAGTRGADAGDAPERFPYSAAEVASIAADLPPAFSWKRRGAVTHVRNQGLCKSCWAFAVVAAVEGALFLRTQRLVALSEQQLLDCASGPQRCSAGNHLHHPYGRVRAAGLAALADYRAYNNTWPEVHQCREEDAPVTKISGYVRVDPSADALKVAIASHGPNVIEVDSSCASFESFEDGVLLDARCRREAREHAVAAVGYGTHRRYGLYFIAKNSWGLWGRRGYVHLHAASNTAGVHSFPSYPLLAADDVQTLPRRVDARPDEPSIFDTDPKIVHDYLQEQERFRSLKRY